jgi:high mobility group protein B2
LKLIISYFAFLAQERKNFQKENPSLSFTEATKELGKKWNNLSDSEKGKFNEIAAKDKERYQKENEKYISSGAAAKFAKANPKVSKKVKKGEKDPNAPKKPLSAYMIFAKEKRAEVVEKNKTAGFGEIGKLIGDLWKNTSAADKQTYESKALKDKERYKNEMSKYYGQKEQKGGKAQKKSSKFVENESESEEEEKAEEDDEMVDDDDAEDSEEED